MARRERINWTKILNHPRDLVCDHNGYSRLSKQIDKQYRESSDESDGRVCILTNEGLPASAGYDNARSNPSRQAIVYNRTTGLWEHAPLVLSNSNSNLLTVTQASNLVRPSTKHIISNRYKGGNV